MRTPWEEEGKSSRTIGLSSAGAGKRWLPGLNQGVVTLVHSLPSGTQKQGCLGCRRGGEGGASGAGTSLRHCRKVSEYGDDSQSE